MVNITQPTLSQKGIIHKTQCLLLLLCYVQGFSLFKDYNLFNNSNQSVFLRYLTVKINFTMPMCSHGRDDKKEFVLLM